MAGDELLADGAIVCAAGGDERLVAQRGLSRALAAHGDVERPADASERADEFGTTGAPADPLAGQSVDFREGAGDENVLVQGRERQAASRGGPS